jgi:hypothetical protein
MSDRKPLMPKATAAWLVENTALTFEQIADFCQMHLLEVKGIADGDVAAGIKGMDPISSGQLTREEIARAEQNPSQKLKLAEARFEMPQVKPKRGPRYTPTSRRHERPNAVLWLLRNHSELKDSQIMRLVGTTKPTIQQIRERSHWNSANLQPQDPVTLGLCSQIDLDAEVRKSAKRGDRVATPEGQAAEESETLRSAADTTGYVPGGGLAADAQEDEAETSGGSEKDEEARVLEQLRGLTGGNDADDVESDDESDDDSDDEKAGQKP